MDTFEFGSPTYEHVDGRWHTTWSITHDVAPGDLLHVDDVPTFITMTLFEASSTVLLNPKVSTGTTTQDVVVENQTPSMTIRNQTSVRITVEGGQLYVDPGNTGAASVSCRITVREGQS